MKPNNIEIKNRENRARICIYFPIIFEKLKYYLEGCEVKIILGNIE